MTLAMNHPERRPSIGNQRIADILTQLVPSDAVFLSDEEIQRQAGLTDDEMAALRAPTKTSMRAVVYDTHTCGDAGDPNNSWEYAWTRSYPDLPPGIDFALTRRSRQGEQSVLAEIPPKLREVALEAVKDPSTWREFVEDLQRGYFVSWHPTIFAGLRALRDIRMVSATDAVLLDNAAVHMRIAASALVSAAGLLERVSDEDQPRRDKIQPLLDVILEETHALALARPSSKVAGLVSDTAGALRP